jgi:exosome complex RNA-binding protein Rrp4
MKLIKFVDSDGNEVWLNSEKVCRVLTRKEHCSIYTEDGGFVWLSMPAQMAVDILEDKVVLIEPKKKKGAKK